MNTLDHVQGYFLGLDIGQMQDFSALTLLARRIEVPDPLAWDSSMAYSMYYPVVMRQFDLGTPYYVIEKEVARIWALPELMVSENWIAVDATGVGSPIVENLRMTHGLPVQSIIITGGETAKQVGDTEYHVGKEHLVTALVDMVQRKRLIIPEGVDAYDVFFNQLEVFGYKVNKSTGNVSWEAMKEQVHDDVIISVALALWMAERVHPFRIPEAGGGGSDERNYDPLG